MKKSYLLDPNEAPSKPRRPKLAMTTTYTGGGYKRSRGAALIFLALFVAGIAWQVFWLIPN